MLDAQLMFAYDGKSRVAQQLIVVQERTCNGVLYCYQRNHVGVLLHGKENLLESVALDEVKFFVLEEPVRCYIVEASPYALYCYLFFHINSKGICFWKGKGISTKKKDKYSVLR